MQTARRRKLSKGALCGACVLACGGFDPEFAPPAPPPVSAGLAGWSYDAGVAPDAAAGRKAAATPPAGGGSTAKPPTPGEPDEHRAGEGGAAQAEAGEGGELAALAGSNPGLAGAGGVAGTGVPQGGQFASSGGWSGRVGSAGASSASSGGAPAGGVAGQAGSSGLANGSSGSAGSAAGASSGGVAGVSGGAGQASGSGGAGAGGALEHALLFSEYVETSSSFKALEIRAERPSTLDGCKIGIYSNGSTTASNSVRLSGELAAGDVYLVCSKTLGEELGAACDATPGNLNFNGNDSVTLECEGAPLDCIGQIGVDPGVAWQSGEASTADRTLRRRCAITEGDAVTNDPFDPSAEWASLPDNTFTGLGDPACE
jgi:hypothetical protein